jgi:hypothetical protein
VDPGLAAPAPHERHTSQEPGTSPRSLVACRARFRSAAIRPSSQKRRARFETGRSSSPGALRAKARPARQRERKPPARPRSLRRWRESPPAIVLDYWLALLGAALLGLLRTKRALLVLRLRSIAARRASTCWACLLCGPCVFPLTPPDGAKCVGIFRLPAAVDIVATASLPAWPESLDTAVSNTGVPIIVSRRSIARRCHQALPCCRPLLSRHTGAAPG